ncbi:hypothetical protein C8R42DRAFT_663287 [Lentinula raphanica]|nr:hypothetical protein C8R42DRAFT_663287 [Lentinula raphanica]
MRSSVINLAFFFGLSMFVVSTCRPMPGGSPLKPAVPLSDASKPGADPSKSTVPSSYASEPGAGPSKPNVHSSDASEPGADLSRSTDSLESDTWSLVNSERDEEPTSRSNSPAPDDPQAVHFFYGPADWTNFESEKEFYDAAIEWSERTNPRFEIIPTPAIPVRNDFGLITAELRSSPGTKQHGGDGLSLRRSSEPRDTMLSLSFQTGKGPNREVHAVNIAPAKLGGKAEFAKTEEGKITVQAIPSSDAPLHQEPVHVFYSAAWSKEEQKYVDAAKEWSDRTEQWPSDFEFDIIPTSNIPVTLEDGILCSQISSTKTVEEHGRGAIWLKLSEKPSDTMVMIAIQTGGVRIGDKYGRWKFARTKEGKITVIPKKTKS